eukprot:915491-Karenia_brevis.AAC.1
MVYAREAIACSEYTFHVRSDSSPQFGKNYFLAELDYAPKHVGWTEFAATLKSRMLPIQCIGVRKGIDLYMEALHHLPRFRTSPTRTMVRIT